MYYGRMAAMLMMLAPTVAVAKAKQETKPKKTTAQIANEKVIDEMDGYLNTEQRCRHEDVMQRPGSGFIAKDERVRAQLENRTPRPYQPGPNEDQSSCPDMADFDAKLLKQLPRFRAAFVGYLRSGTDPLEGKPVFFEVDGDTVIVKSAGMNEGVSRVYASYDVRPLAGLRFRKIVYRNSVSGQEFKVELPADWTLIEFDDEGTPSWVVNVTGPSDGVMRPALLTYRGPRWR